MSEESEMSAVIRYTAITIGILSILTVLTVGYIMYGEYTSTNGPEYDSGYTEGYAEGYSEHDEDRYSFCKEYFSHPHYRNANPRMVGYSKGYVQGYEEYMLL